MSDAPINVPIVEHFSSVIGLRAKHVAGLKAGTQHSKRTVYAADVANASSQPGAVTVGLALRSRLSGERIALLDGNLPVSVSIAGVNFRIVRLFAVSTVLIEEHLLHGGGAASAR